jgi:hypothetical protein
VPKAIAKFFPADQVRTAAQMGWKNLSNGDLLAHAAEQFDLFVTTDKNIRHEQNLLKLPIPIIELNSKDSRLQALQVLRPFIQRALQQIKKHRFVAVHTDGNIEIVAQSNASN